jgi:hypothetical protein
LGSIVGLLALIGVGVGVGVAVSHKSNNRSATSGSKSSTTSNSSAVPQTNPNDPSTFVKDPRLINSFWGMAYTPADAIPPNCGSTLGTFFPVNVFFSFGVLAFPLLYYLADVISDIQVRFRTFFVPTLYPDIFP